MPVFMDTHQGTNLPADLRRQVEERVRSGQKDRFGVIDRGIVIDKDGNKMHCILEGPDADAVMKHHESLNVPLQHESIHRAEAILK